MPFFRDLAKLFTSSGPVNVEIARQFAQWTATGGQVEDNVDPVQRMRLEELARVAELHVDEATGLQANASVVAVSRGEWALRTLEAWQPLLERLASSLTVPIGDGDGDEDADPTSELLGSLPQLMGPVLFGMQSGTMVGQLAQRAMGQYDLPIPRPGSDQLLVVPSTVDAFASDWSLPLDDVRLWVCVSELALHAVLTRPHVRDRLQELLLEYASAFEPDSSALESRLNELDPSHPEQMAEMFDVTAVLGDIESEKQRTLRPQLEALSAVLVGYADWIVDVVGRRLITSYPQLSEALRRRRVEETESDRFVERLLGLRLDQAQYDRGSAFIRGVLERAGDEGLSRLWRSARELPTPAEVAAPGLWLARIDLPD
jgi:putative hydrolase